jgi:hypothetical protein
MELFARLFGGLLLFVYQCFEIHGYLSGLSRLEQLVYFFRQVVGVPQITKEVLSRRTQDYQRWVEAFAANHDIPITWAEKGVRHEEEIRPYLRQREKPKRYAVYFILKSLEQAFRSTPPKYPTADPRYRLLAKPHSRFTHHYVYPRRNRRPSGDAGGLFLSLSDHLLVECHRLVEQELNRQGIAFRKQENAFLGVAHPKPCKPPPTVSPPTAFARAWHTGRSYSVPSFPAASGKP